MGYTEVMRAGTAEAEIDLPLGIPMMGYGARTGVARERHDALHARALHFESGSAGGERALIVQLEVCLLSVPQAQALAAAVARRTGLAPGEIWIAATHTHSGPETGIVAALAGDAPPEFTAPVFAAAETAALRACEEAFPARIGLGSTQAQIGRNRRAAAGAIDREVVVLRVDDADGRTRAVAFVHGTHPTVLGHENLAWSADWPGAAGAAVRDAFPDAMPLFLLGAHADVDPRTRGLQDLAVSGGSAGAGFDACEALGREVGNAVVAAARAIETRDDALVTARSAALEIPVHGGSSDAAHEAVVEARRREAARALGLDPDQPLRVSQVFALESERTRSLAPEEKRERLARARLFVRDRTAPRVAGGLRPRVEIRVLGLGEARWLGVPAEATAELGLAWKTGRAPGSALLSNVGGWLRYLPHPHRFAASDGHHHYEVLMSTLEPDAALRLLAAGADLANRSA